MTVKNNSGTRMTKTSIKSAMTEVTQPKVYTADQDYYDFRQQEGASGVETQKILVVRQGQQISEQDIDRLFPTAAVTSITPATGLAAGGTVVTIKGSNLRGTSGVTFGGTAGTSFSVNTDGDIKVTTPAKAAGTYDVVVQDDAANVTVTNGFVYT